MSTDAPANRRGRPPTGQAMSSTERSKAHRAKLSGRTVCADLDACAAANLDRVKAKHEIRTDADAIRFALELASH